MAATRGGYRAVGGTAPPPPARAWLEHEPAAAESRRLLPSPSPSPPAAPHKSRLQAGLTLAIPHAPSDTKCSLPAKFGHPKPKTKTKSQKRKDKLIAAFAPPYFILSMIIVMVVLHVYGSADVRAALEWSPGGWWQEPWRLLSYGWLHATNAHLALNALVALAVGWRLECEQRWWRVGLAWVGGVMAGALGAGALQPRVRVVGASAAVYALLLAHLPNVCLRFGHIPLWWFRPLSVVVLAASEGCWALVRAPPALLLTTPALPPPPADHVAWAAHVCGALVGVPIAFLVFTGENASKPYVFVSRVVSAATMLCATILATFYYVYWAEFDQRP